MDSRTVLVISKTDRCCRVVDGGFDARPSGSGPTNHGSNARAQLRLRRSMVCLSSARVASRTDPDHRLDENPERRHHGGGLTRR